MAGNDETGANWALTADETVDDTTQPLQLIDNDNKENAAEPAKRGPGRPRKNTDGLDDGQKKPSLDEALKASQKSETKYKNEAKALRQRLEIVLASHKTQEEKFKGSISDLKLKLDEANLRNDNLKSGLDEANMEISDIAGRLVEREETIKAQSDELDELKAELIEKENELSDLMQELVQESKPSSTNKPKPQGVVLVDSVTSPLVEHLPKTIEWSSKTINLTEIDRSTEEEVREADICLILSGSAILKTGTTAVTLFRSMTDFLEKNASSTCMMVADLPPSKHRATSVQVRLFNYQLGQDKSKVYQHFSPAFGSKDDLVEIDGYSMSAKCIDLWASEIKSSIKTPDLSSLKKKKQQIATACASYEVTELVQIPNEAIGSVIGHKGSVIRGLTDEFSTKMSIGKWFEKRKGTDEYEEKYDGVVVTGRQDLVRQACCKVKELSSSSEPKAKKKKI